MARRVYIFRHGDAASREEASVRSDADRPLVAEGVRKTEMVAEALQRMDVAVDVILTSPWVRARQTADVVGRALKSSARVEEMEELAGDRSVEDVIRGLGRYNDRENVMLIGHQPLLGDVAAYLLSLSTGMLVDLKKSGVCAIEIERLPPNRPGTLLWMLAPKQLKILR